MVAIDRKVVGVLPVFQSVDVHGDNEDDRVNKTLSGLV